MNYKGSNLIGYGFHSGFWVKNVSQKAAHITTMYIQKDLV